MQLEFHDLAGVLGGPPGTQWAAFPAASVARTRGRGHDGSASCASGMQSRLGARWEGRVCAWLWGVAVGRRGTYPASGMFCPSALFPYRAFPRQSTAVVPT